MKKIDITGYCHGITTMGERGQVVIPQEARRKLKLKNKEKLFVYSRLGKILILIKTSEWDNLIKFMLSFEKPPVSKKINISSGGKKGKK